MGQNHVALVNIKIAGKWMFIPLKMVLIGIDPYPYGDWWFIMINSGYRLTDHTCRLGVFDIFLIHMYDHGILTSMRWVFKAPIPGQ